MTPFRVLLVEDNDDHALLIEDLLTEGRRPVEVVHEAGGDAALARLARSGPEGLPHLVLLDLDMPGMDGFETLSRIKGDPATAGVPVVILTTSNVRRDVARAMEGRADSYVCKTADFAELERALAGVKDCWAPH